VLLSCLRTTFGTAGATIFALLSWQGVLLSVGVLMAGYVTARAVAGLLDSRRTSTVDVCALFLGYMAAQGAAGATLVRLFPGGG